MIIRKKFRELQMCRYTSEMVVMLRWIAHFQISSLSAAMWPSTHCFFFLIAYLFIVKDPNPKGGLNGTFENRVIELLEVRFANA
jgi:hypothetical protein